MGDSLEILPRTVREILKVNNDEILRLCKVAAIPLRQNNKGLTYFTTDDVKTLKRLQEVQLKTKEIEKKSVQLKQGLKKLPAKKLEIVKKDRKENLPDTTVQKETIALLKQITGAVKNIETGFYDKFSLLLDEKLENKLESKLEEKLGGIDAVIMDLVRCKSEADDMRKQLAKNDKEIYSLKNELASYKKVAGNLYIKKKIEEPFKI